MHLPAHSLSLREQALGYNIFLVATVRSMRAGGAILQVMIHKPLILKALAPTSCYFDLPPLFSGSG